MREIKFRAWDGEHMSANPRIYIVGGTSGHINDYFAEAAPLILMQYTGVHAKNGVDIYEGDVVRGRSYYQDEDGSNEGFDVETSAVTFKGHAFDFGGISPDEFGELEVIGNIYENPELLK